VWGRLEKQKSYRKILATATRTMLRRFWLVLALLVSNVFFLPSSCCYAVIVDEDDSERISYGTEVSWPMQHHVYHDDDNDDNAAVTNSKKNLHEPPDAPISTMTTMILQAQQRQRYDDYMAGCAQTYGAELCHANDRDRIQLNAVQPARQHQNFTSTGYAVVPVPTMAWDVLERFWLAKGHDRWQHNKEYWEHGSIYTNHWVAPTYHVPIDIDDDDDKQVRNTMVESVQTVLEKWSGTPLLFSSTYGVRVYTQDSILAPHIDRYVYRRFG
jgi:hypothetical protein